MVIYAYKCLVYNTKLYEVGLRLYSVGQRSLHSIFFHRKNFIWSGDNYFPNINAPSHMYIYSDV